MIQRIQRMLLHWAIRRRQRRINRQYDLLTPRGKAAFVVGIIANDKALRKELRRALSTRDRA